MNIKSSLASLPPTPLLSQSYSGISKRLAPEARRAKKLLFSNRTTEWKGTARRDSPVLPPGITREAFDTAVLDLKSTLGAENVDINDKPLNDGWYMEHPNTHDAYHILPQDQMVCSAIAYPSSTSEVSSIMKWANKHLIPCYPISMGRNIGYGGAAPRVPGSVVIDLGRRMNKILKIDGHNASCILEPGVSYFALYEAVRASGYPLWIDTPDLGGGSVMGNALDRGVGYTPYGDHFANHCGMEIVLPDGSVMRTGMGALPGEDGADNPCWQSFQPAYGPYSDGMFSQSNYGIVTKMGFWLMPETGHQSYMVTFPDEDSFADIVEIIRPLALKRILGNVPQLRHVIQELAVTGKPKSFWWPGGEGRMPREVIRQHASNLPCGDVSWVFYGCQYGDSEALSAQFKLLKGEFAKIPGSKFYFPEDVPDDHYLHSRAKVCSGEPVLKELDWLNWVPNGAHTFFSPITPTSGKHARTILDIATNLHQKWGFDHLPTFCILGREVHYIANVVYDRFSPSEKRRAMNLMREMIDASAKKGYGEYRTHILFADQVMGTYGWNEQALRRFNEKIKDALDPNGVLAPGRNGIWPAKYRERGWELGIGNTGEDGIVQRKSRL